MCMCIFFRGLECQELRAKGYDAFAILRWLREELAEVTDPQYDHISAMVWLADSWVTMLCDGEDFISENCAKQIQVLGESFLKLYLQAAHLQPKVWKIRPKWHLVHHLILDAAMRRSHRNPSRDSTWMDEDWMKKVTRVIRRTHRKTSPLTTLQRYLMFLQQKIRLHAGKHS